MHIPNLKLYLGVGYTMQKLKVNAEHSSYGTLNSRKKKSKQKICRDVETYTYIVGTILPTCYIYMLIQAFA